MAAPTLRAAENFHAYRLYYLGNSFHGLPLTHVGRGSGREPDRSWYFIYGTCEPEPGQEGCAPPLDIQNESTCVRPPRLERTELTRFRGALITPRVC